MKKLAIITTHPIQYNAPLFALLTQRGKIEVRVFYTWSQSVGAKKYDPDFGRNIEWDIPLLDGYEYSFVKNISKSPGSHHNKGIINPTLVEEINQWGATSVLIFGWNFHSHTQAIRYFHKKIKVIFRGDSTLLDEVKGIKKILKSIYLKWIYKHIDIALYTGTRNKAYYKKFGMSDKKLVFAPHAIDNSRFGSAKNHLLKDWRIALGIKAKDIMILFAGKLEPKKNPQLLLEAFPEFVAPDPHRNANFHLVIVGNGILEAELKQKYSNERIHFVDFQNQSMMPAVYTACDIFVLPSAGPGETWGLAVNEAMACGKPVLVSDKCGCAVDLVKNGINGAIFKSGDVKSLITAFNHLPPSKENLLKMGKESYNIIKVWNYDLVCEQLEKVVSGNTP